MEITDREKNVIASSLKETLLNYSRHTTDIPLEADERLFKEELAGIISKVEDSLPHTPSGRIAAVPRPY